MGNERIRWSHREKELMAETVVKLLANGYPNKLATYREAMEMTLPASRHRFVNSIKNFDVVEEMVAAGGPPKAFTLTPTNTPLPPAINVAQKPTQENLESELATEVIAEMLEKVLVRTIKRVISSPELAPILNSLLNRMMPSTQVAHKPVQTQIATAQHARTPVVLICGIKPHNQGYLQSKFDKKLNLRFYFDENGKSLNSLDSKLEGADRILVSTEATSHTHLNMIKKAGKRVTRVTGANSSMEAALASIFEEFRNPVHTKL